MRNPKIRGSSDENACAPTFNKSKTLRIVNVLRAVVDPDLEERGWCVVMMKWRACFVQKSINMEGQACKFREILIDDQESLSSVFQFQFFPST